MMMTNIATDAFNSLFPRLIMAQGAIPFSSLHQVDSHLGLH